MAPSATRTDTSDAATAATAGPADTAGHAARVAEQGWTVLENVIDESLVGELTEALGRLETDLGVGAASNSFEGRTTVRIYNLLAHDAVFRRVPTHPAVLPVVEGVLDEGCLISSLSSIAIDPGESAQPIHADDQLIPIPKPHPPTVCNTMWALTEFTEANGATRLVPGTHTADHSPDLSTDHDWVAAEMTAGSVLVWHGSLWHGGGANRTDRRRLGVAMNYCAGWIRQQENQQLGLSLETVRSFGPRLAELCGFGTYAGLIGHIDKQTPAHALLGAEAGPGMVWDGS